MNNDPKILKNQFINSCPDAETFEKYLAGKLEAKQIKLVEQHFAECELCREAIEGYRSSNEVLSVSEETEIINKKINHLLEDKTQKEIKHNRKPDRIIYLVAASAALLFVSVLIWQLLRQPQQIQNKIRIATKESTEKLTEEKKQNQVLAYQEPLNIGIPKDKNSINKVLALKNQATDKVTEESAGDDLNLTEPEESLKKITENSGISREEPEFTEKEFSLQEDNHKFMQHETITEENQKLALTDSAAKSDYYYQNAIIENNKGNTSLALKLAKMSVNADPGNMDALYYLAILYFNGKNYQEAADRFNVVIKNSVKNQYEASWYLALCYLETGDTNNARKILKELAKQEGRHKTEAEQILKSLE